MVLKDFETTYLPKQLEACQTILPRDSLGHPVSARTGLVYSESVIGRFGAPTDVCTNNEVTLCAGLSMTPRVVNHPI